MAFALRPRVLRAAALALVLGAALTGIARAQMGSAPPGHDNPAGPTLSADDIQRLNGMIGDSTRAGAAAKELESYLAQGPQGMYRMWATQALLGAQIRLHAPVPTITALTDTLFALAGPPGAGGESGGSGTQGQITLLATIAEVLAQRPDGIDVALRYVQRASRLVPPTPDALPLLGMTKAVTGVVEMKAGHLDKAIAALTEAIPFAPDSQRVLFALGQAQQQAKRPDAAIAAYVRSLAAFPGPDTAAAAPLRELWKQKNGSLAGMDRRVAAAREVAKRRVALEGRRDERPAPELSLAELADSTRTVTLKSLRGKVVLLDFWGSWCGPCRMELPLFLSLRDKYSKRADVVFLGVNWERSGATAERRERAKSYLAENQFEFRSLFDPTGEAAQSFGVQGFPTVYVVDREGRIRYSNQGFVPGVEEILDTQIASLLGK